MSDSVRPQRWQPTRLSCPWDSPGKNTGVGCHFLLQCMTVKSESEVAQSCPTLSDPMDCSPPGSSMGVSRQDYWSGVPLPSPLLTLGEYKSLWTSNKHICSLDSIKVSNASGTITKLLIISSGRDTETEKVSINCSHYSYSETHGQVKTHLL